MAKFVFPMNKILVMKEKLENQAKIEYSQAIAELNAELDKHQSLEERQGMAEMELRQTVSDSLNVREIREKEDALEIIKMYVRQHEIELRVAEEKVEKAREALNEAMQERKIYEKLKEKALDEYKIEEAKIEQKEIDELVSYRFGSAQSEG